MKVEVGETRLRGIPISNGIAIGQAYFYKHAHDEIPEIKISKNEIAEEVKRYQEALELGIQDLKRLQKQMAKEKAIEAAWVLDAHLQVMKDPLLVDNIISQIRSQKRNAEYVFHQSVKFYQEKFSAMSDPVFREKGRDLLDIAKRILGYLQKAKRISLANIPANSIVISREVVASEIAEAKSENLCGLITENDGIASHAAIVAKAKLVPYVTNINLSILEKTKNSQIIIDGRVGEVIVNPMEETIAKYKILKQQLQDHFQYLEKMSLLHAETFDGYRIRLSANIEMMQELDILHQYGGSGVGLFRSEYIFLSRQDIPSEEEQFFIYRRLVERMNGLPIVIRTFDLGGDKLNLHQEATKEGNPYLGLWSNQLQLKGKELFKTQLRAILRASAFGEVNIMFPMVTGLSDFIEAKKMVREIQEQLKDTLNSAKPVRIGSMIEVPSAAIISDLLAKECDFLSIGTNDLVQYSLAADRANYAVSVQYTPTHPSVIRLIKLVVSQANQYGVPVSICGEVAADPRFTVLLLGLGIQELSVASRYLPIIKHAIRNSSIIHAVQLAERVLRSTTCAEIQEILAKEYQQNAPNDFLYNY